MIPSVGPQYDILERQDKLAVFDGAYLSGIPEYLAQWKSTRTVLVVSRSLYNNTQYVQKLEHVLGDKIVGKKIGVGAHSPYQDVIEIAHLLQENQADSLVSIGSSSYNDAAKIATKLASTLPPNFNATDMENVVDQTKGSGVLKDATVRLILVPTSLSAAEWNGVGSCTNSKGKKQHYGSHNMISGAADLVFCDPELASTAPESLWLSSGARCIDHCIETICNRACTAQSEHDALAGLAEMVRGLTEYKQGARQANRAKFLRGISDAQRGSRQAIKDIIVNRNSCGPSHAIGHQLGSVAGVGHGVTSCILLAPTLKYTLASPDPVFERTKSGQEKILDVFNRTLGWSESSAAEAVTRFFKTLGLPTTLTEVGVEDEERIDRVAEATLTDIWGAGAPQITSKAEVRKILDLARR